MIKVTTTERLYCDYCGTEMLPIPLFIPDPTRIVNVHKCPGCKKEQIIFDKIYPHTGEYII